MAFAASLSAAAGLSYSQMNIYWLAGTLQARVETFCASSFNTFPDDEPKARPVADWLTVLDSLQAAFEIDANTLLIEIEQMAQAVKLVYRACWLCDYLVTQGLASSAQGVTFLGNWNAAFGS